MDSVNEIGIEMHGIWSKKLALKILFIGIGIGLLLNHYFTRINHSKYKVLSSQPKKLIVKDKNLDLPTHDLYLGPDFPKRDAVKSAFKHAWFAYERDAWGSDEYHPISQSGSNLSNSAGIGYTIIDSLYVSYYHIYRTLTRSLAVILFNSWVSPMSMPEQEIGLKMNYPST